MPRKPKKEKLFPTEADLCAAFVKALPEGWTPYAETAGWDILLVRDEDGFQIGVQAKLKMNVEVINQAIEESGRYRADWSGPDCRAVLVPENAGNGLDKICAYVGLTIIRVCGAPRLAPAHFAPALPERTDWSDDWYELASAKRHELPEYVPDVRAGAASPLQLTAWKIKALKITALLEERGFVTRRDFAHLRLDHRRWVAAGWLKAARVGYVADGAMPAFREQHPVVYEQVKADAAWRPLRELLDTAAIQQAAML